MQHLTVTIKDESKTQVFLDIIRELDFVEVLTNGTESTAQDDGNYDFFGSAGMWRNKDIDAGTLRKKAWNRNK